MNAVSGAVPVRAVAQVSPGLAALKLARLLGLQPVTTDLMQPALPALAADLGATMAPAQLTMSALILAFGLAQLVWGPVADRVGRRPVLLLGLALYTVASIGAALAGSVMLVVAWRVLQGAAGAPLRRSWRRSAAAQGRGPDRPTQFPQPSDPMRS